jgi:hypothetical protein
MGTPGWRDRIPEPKYMFYRLLIYMAVVGISGVAAIVGGALMQNQNQGMSVMLILGGMLLLVLEGIGIRGVYRFFSGRSND